MSNWNATTPEENFVDWCNFDWSLSFHLSMCPSMLHWQVKHMRTWLLTNVALHS